MRPIDKSKKLSTSYHTWLETLSVPHPEKETMKCHVVMNLLYCQQGLCAYTEKFLCGSKLLNEKNWQDGKYVKNPPEHMPEKSGELEHFDPQLKKTKYWEWDNLFVVYEPINRRKSDKETFPILKPDSAHYDPFKFLAYDFTTHRFVVNPAIEDPVEKYQVEEMIKTLGLNFGSIVEEREKFFGEVEFDQEYSPPPRVYQFFTANEMILKQKAIDSNIP